MSIGNTLSAVFLALSALIPHAAAASPYQDMEQFQYYFINRFGISAVDDYAFGSQAFDPKALIAAKESSSTVKHIALIEQGRHLFDTPFSNGASYASCFRNAETGLATDYPYIDAITSQVRTLPLELNLCRSRNGERPLTYDSGDMLNLQIYLVSRSKGNRINTIVLDEANSLAIYNQGKRFFYARRGQQNMACAHCHIDHSGKRLRDKVIPPALGITSRAPMVNDIEGNAVSLHQQFSRCMQRMGAKPLELQGVEYRNLEFFISYINNGLPIQPNGTNH